MSPHSHSGLVVLTVDDELPAVEQMKWLLEADPLVESVHTATSVAAAKTVLDRHRVDVVLLDIHMPGPTGMDLAHELRRQDHGDVPHVIFVTADARPAVHAFELDALDYLLKPVRPARLHEALRKTLNRVETGSMTQVPEQGRVTVQQGAQQLFVPIGAIRWAQAQGDYARIYTEDDSYLLRISLAGIEEEWAAYDFVRIHRSHIVNLNYAQKIVQQDGKMFIFIGDTELAVSRRLMPQVRQRLKQLNFRSVPRSGG